jgi:uncharacterized tellurite resistance protein B-like protein
MRTGLRCQGDIEQAGRLAKFPDIETYAQRRSRDKLDDTRRHLLSSSVRLTRALAPELHEVVDHCAKRLEIDKECEVYVSPSPHFNAFSYRGSNDRVFVGVTSSLFEAFDREELTFVIGHELGHYLCNHLELPRGEQLRNVDQATALSLSAWHRLAEISADRAGLECTRDVGAVARTFLKLSSGLTSKNIRYDIDEYLRQLNDLREASSTETTDAIRDEWMSSHPFSPLRVRAAQLAWASSLFTSGGTSLDLLEVSVQNLLSMMEPDYAADRTTEGEAMRRVLLAAGVSIAAADGTMDANEVAALARFLGEPPTASPAALRADLPRRLAFASEHVAKNKRYQLVRDLCVIAYADRNVTADETALLREVADGLGVDPAFIDMSLVDIARGLD